MDSSFKHQPLAFFLLLSSMGLSQHDPGRDAVILLGKNQTAAAIKEVAKKPHAKNSRVSDAERHFVLAMVACQQGDAAAAFVHAKQAVEDGLPVDRLQAGPREILAPLHAHGEFVEWMKTRQKSLLHGPMLGSLTDASARFWVRTAGDAEVSVVVKPEHAAQSMAVVEMAKTSGDSDFTAVIEVDGLAPDTGYTYQVLVNREVLGAQHAFRTFPVQGTPSRFKIAFGGGAGFTPQNERMWTTIRKQDPRALLLLGDNVYIDDPTHRLTQDYCYYRRQSQAEWKQLVSSLSVFSIYDDHDFGKNDCNPGPEIETPEWKRQVWNAYTQNWNNPSYGGGAKQPGCWYDFHIGDVQFIMLDGRYYRDLKGGSMLGPVQKSWLFETLKSSTAQFKVLVSPVPWSPGVKPGSKDTWDGFPEEREEVFTLIESARIDGVLLMSADRHRSDMRKIKRANGYDFYDVMSSRLTNNHTHGLMKEAKGSEFIMGYNQKCSVGLVDFDTTADDPTLKFSIINIDGQLIDSRTLKLSELSFGGH